MARTLPVIKQLQVVQDEDDSPPPSPSTSIASQEFLLHDFSEYSDIVSSDEYDADDDDDEAPPELLPVKQEPEDDHQYSGGVSRKRAASSECQDSPQSHRIKLEPLEPQASCSDQQNRIDDQHRQHLQGDIGAKRGIKRSQSDSEDSAAGPSKVARRRYMAPPETDSSSVASSDSSVDDEVALYPDMKVRLVGMGYSSEDDNLGPAVPFFIDFPTPGGIVRLLSPAAVNASIVDVPEAALEVTVECGVCGANSVVHNEHSDEEHSDEDQQPL